MFFMIAQVLAIAVFSDLSLSTIFSLASYKHPDLIFLLTVCLILAASAKSALLPFTPWLLKAMAGPTSVSALLHSSTKVTAGVYLLKRISPLLELSSTSLMIIIWLGSLGALFGAMLGLVDNDIKRITACSTASQLGYKIVAIGVSNYHQAFFHLLKHAFFIKQATQHTQETCRGFQLKQNINSLRSTYLKLKLDTFWRQERLTKVNCCKNCVIVRKKASLGYKSLYIKYIQERIYEKLYIKKSRNIGEILTLSHELEEFRVKIFLVWQCGKPVHPYHPSKLQLLVNGDWRRVASSRVQDSHQAKAIFNHLDRSKGSNTWFACCKIGILPKKLKGLAPRFPHLLVRLYSNCNGQHTPKNNIKGAPILLTPSFISLRQRKITYFKEEVKEVYKLHYSKEELHLQLEHILTKYLHILIIQREFETEGARNRILAFLTLTIQRLSLQWGKKKYPRINATKRKELTNQLPIFSNPFQYTRSRYILLKSSYPPLIQLPYIPNSLILFTKDKTPVFGNLKLLPNHAVIYIFWSTLNPLKCYVGASENIVRRVRTHISSSNTNKNHPKFYSHQMKYGWDNKAFQILELVPNKHEILDRENYWLDIFFTNYPETILNILTHGSTRKGIKHSDETKTKISEAHMGKALSSEHRKKISDALIGKVASADTLAKKSNANMGRTVLPETRKKISEAHMGKVLSLETRKKISEANMGKVLSLETRKKISEANLGHTRVLSAETRQRISLSNKGRIVSPETRNKQSLSTKGRKAFNGKSIVFYTLDLYIIRIYPSQTEAYRFLKIGNLKFKDCLLNNKEMSHPEQGTFKISKKNNLDYKVGDQYQGDQSQGD